MEPGVALLLTDRSDRSATLAHALDTAFDTVVLGVSETRSDSTSLACIVADLDLHRSAARRFLKTHRAGPDRRDAPLICLLRTGGDRSFSTAMALGATVCLPSDAPPKSVVDSLLRHTHPDTEADRVRVARGVSRAGTALAGLLDAVRLNGTFERAAFEAGLNPILGTVSEAGLAHWLDVVWSYDEATYQHCLLVAGLAAAFAGHLGFSASDRLQFVRAALIHDVGKACIPLAILNKPDRLDADEMAVMRTHAARGAKILEAAGGFDAATLDAVRHHHEMLDGSGYPEGLAGDAITDFVRMITICDVYAALIERRPYRAPMPAPQAIRILDGMSGQLDPDLLRAFGGAILTEAPSTRPHRDERAG